MTSWQKTMLLGKGRRHTSCSTALALALYTNCTSIVLLAQWYGRRVSLGLVMEEVLFSQQNGQSDTSISALPDFAQIYAFLQRFGVMLQLPNVTLNELEEFFSRGNYSVKCVYCTKSDRECLVFPLRFIPIKTHSCKSAAWGISFSLLFSWGQLVIFDITENYV